MPGGNGWFLSAAVFWGSLTVTGVPVEEAEEVVEEEEEGGDDPPS